MSTRTRLPDRRPQVIAAIEWSGRFWPIGVGFDAEGRVREVFADGCKSGQDLEGLLDDACILMSLLLQSGMGVTEVAERLGREGVDPAAPAASPIGYIARTAAHLEREQGAAMAAAFAAVTGQRFVARAPEGSGPETFGGDHG